MSLLPSKLAIKGIDNFLSNYVNLNSKDGVVICYSSACLQVVSWLTAAISLQEIPLITYCFNHRDDSLFEQALDEVLGALKGGHDVEQIDIIICEFDTFTFSRPLKKLKDANSNISIFRLTNCIPDLFELAFQVTPKEQKQINAYVLNKLVDAKEISVKTTRGTDLVISLDSSRFTWVSNYGHSKLGELMILPCGEVNTFPASISGRLVADGAINLNLSVDFDVRLAKHPITFEIENGVLANFNCDNSSVLEFLNYIFSIEFSRNVGEFGIGTNIGIERFIALNSHINERHPGVHIGFGQHGQPGRVHYLALTHLDAIIADATICIDGAVVIETSCLKPSEVPHPSQTHSEDTEQMFEEALI